MKNLIDILPAWNTCLGCYTRREPYLRSVFSVRNTKSVVTKQVLILLFLFISQFVAAQQKKIDSIKKLYVTTTADTLKLNYANQLAQLYSTKPNEALRYNDEGLRIAERLNRSYDIAFGKGFMAAIYGNEGNYPLAIKNGLECFKISEDIHNSYLLMTACDLLGNLYDDLKDEQKAIYYTKQEVTWAQKRNDGTILIIAYEHLSSYYNALSQPQQALAYDRLADKKVTATHNDTLKGRVYAGMGHSYLLLHRPDTGLALMRKAIELSRTQDLFALIDAYRYTSDYYAISGPRDSAIKYAEKQLEYSKQLPYEAGILNASAKLARQYDGHDQGKAAFYYKMAFDLNQRLFDAEKTRDFQNMTEADEQRRRELAEQQRAAEEERKENLQLIAIALFIPVFIIVLFRLRRTRLHRRVIDFMGVLSLLLVFEFITLLSHPFIERITGHTPVFELITLVAVASFLVPAHHQLTHWLKERLAKPNREHV